MIIGTAKRRPGFRRPATADVWKMRVEDAGDSELMRKSEPLYRNLENSRSLIRPKYLSGPNKTVIDFNKITLSMIDDGTLLSGRGRTLVFASGRF
mmetsp:Transcript_2223/g.5232  ORF Transcript_2223/g.5232 Transcript_2223/m.5232 type:complete len:95 (+) Transcript_2223:584-868(+)